MSQVKFTCRYLLLTVLLCAVGAGVYAQFEVLEHYPSNFQLYPRNEVGFGNVRIKGTLSSGTSYNSLVLRVFRDSDESSTGENYLQVGQDIEIPVSASREFNYSYQLLAELANYRFNLYGKINSTIDPNALRSASSVVSGDIFMVQGQSNATSSVRGPSGSGSLNNANTDPYISIYRQYIRGYGSSIDPYSSMVKQWGIGEGNAHFTVNYNVGQWPIYFAARVCETERIPVAVINASVNSQPITYYLPIPANRFNLSTAYGRALQRSRDAGVLDNIKAIIWFQGENNWHPNQNGGVTDAIGYKNNLVNLIKYWQQDYSGLNKVYVLQSRYGCWGNSTTAASIAHGQYLAVNDPLLTNTELISTNGIPQAYEVDPDPSDTDPGLTNCHFYLNSGNKPIGERVFLNVSSDVYNRTFSPGTIVSPEPVKAYFTKGQNGIASQVGIELNVSGLNFQITDVNDTLRQLFVLSGNGQFEVTNVSIDVNTSPVKVLLDFQRNGSTLPLENPTIVSFLSYRGGYTAGHTSNNDPMLPVPNVPSIVNPLGIGLISFNGLGIDLGILPVDPLSLFVRRTGNTNNVKWEVEENSDFVRFAVERSTNGTNFSMLTELFGKATSGKEIYNYADVNITGQVFYRIKATRKTGGVVYSQVVRINDNGSLRPGLTISPNPVINQAFINVTVAEKTSASIQLFNLQGARVSQRNVELLKGSNNFSLGEMLDQLPGVYMVKVVTPQEVFTSRLIKLR